MKLKTDRLVAGAFVASLFAASVVYGLSPAAPRFSKLENRFLQSAPKLTWENLMSKKFADDAELFVTDRFPFRAGWLELKSTTERLRLQQENNGIYRGKDGYLFEKFEKPDFGLVGRYADAVKEFALARPEANMTFLLAPASIGLYPERLPWKAPNFSQAKVNGFVGDRLGDSLSFIDGFDVLRPHASEPIYYRTDHHWTTLGAYYAYSEYAKRMGWQPLERNDFLVESVSDDFLGSFHTRGRFSGIKPDEIQAYLPKKPVASEMYVADTGTTSSSLYENSFLEKKDKYSYFLGGVHALSTITSRLSEPDLDKLLVLKDSYAHSLIPFLTQHVAEIHIIDVRYYNGSIGDYMEENGIRDALFLFNTATFAGNGEILKLNR